MSVEDYLDEAFDDYLEEYPEHVEQYEAERWEDLENSYYDGNYEDDFDEDDDLGITDGDINW